MFSKPSKRSTSRWLRLWAASALVAVASGCAKPHAAVVTAEPELRIGIVADRPSVTLGGDGELILTDDANGEVVGSVPAGARWTVMPDGDRLRLVRPDGAISDPHPGVFAVNVTEGRFVMGEGQRFRGRLEVVKGPGGLLLVNRVSLESYVASVVATEMGQRKLNERAAVLAQAIVSRTRALASRGRWEAQGVDAFADTRDQVYTGVAGETSQSWEATRATAGVVVLYEGQPIEAYFHSTCGYRTADVDEAFKSAVPRPYLRSVSDANGDGGYFSDVSPRFRWREEWDAAALRSILSRTLAPVMSIGGDGLPRITNVEVSRTTHSGRVGELHITFERGDVRVPGPDVRGVLRPEPDRLLGSLAFQLEVTRQAGQVTRLVATGVGWGHGVGFCQWGAIGRARAGQDETTILEAYFPGTKVARLY